MVKSNFNLPLLDSLLKDFYDKKLLKFFMFGFPIDHDGGEVSGSTNNHKGAGPEFQEDTDRYLKKELDEGSVIGPFDKIPFEGPCGISPLNSVPKPDSKERRVILDMSFS